MPSNVQAVDLIVIARWIVPVEPPGSVLEDHALVVDRGRIVDLLPADFARQAYRPSELIELGEHLIIPGFINLHTHAAMSLMRGLSDDRTLTDWLQNHIWPAEGRHVSYPYCEDGVRLAACEMIRGGTTCFNDMYFFPDATASVARAAGLRATVGLVVFDFPSAWASSADEYIQKGSDLHDTLRDDALIRTAFAPHAPYTVSDAPFLKLRALADQLAIPVHIHVHETAFEVTQSIERHGMRPWRRLQEHGLIAENLIAVHMTQLTAEEISQAAHAGVHVAHCPESNLKLASGFCPVAALLAAGANVGIGTDGAASNNDLDMLAEMRCAALLAKGVSGDPTVVPAEQALAMATLNGARALGIEEQTGSLVIGKSADFVCIDLSAANTQPVYDVISQLVYATSAAQVTDVFVAGRALMRGRELLTLDEGQILARAREWRDQIRKP